MNFHFPHFEQDGSAVRVFCTLIGSVVAPIIGGLLNAASNIPFSGPAVAILVVVGGIAGFILSPTDRNHAQNRPMSTNPAADQKTSIVEVMSFIVVVLTFIGMVVGIVLPGMITGAILPVATTLWFILYMWMVVIDQKGN